MFRGEVLTLPGEALASVRALGDHLLELSLTLNSLTWTTSAFPQRFSVDLFVIAVLGLNR